MLQAGQMAFWPRIKGARIRDVSSALWKDHTLVKAWAMRRTLFLLPSDELAVFVRGTTRRAAYHYRHGVSRVGSKQELDKLLDRVMGILKEPRTRGEIAQMLNKSHGYLLRSKAGGGWGNRSKVPWVDVGASSLPVGYLLHIIAAREVLCFGQNKGAESTFVRADKWVPHWRDVSVEKAERELLVKYLRAYSPATLQDFALWAGMYVRDAKEIWALETGNMVSVDVEGWKASILEQDLPELEKAEVEQPVVRFLPFFDSFILGHKNHQNIVDEKNRKKIYRNQGWVSPILLVDGRAQGVWSHTHKRDGLEVHVTPFAKLSSQVSSQLKEEVSDLDRFLECERVTTTFD